MQRPQTTKRTAGGVITLLAMLSVAAGSGGQAAGPTGYLPKDRVVELAAASDGSLASYAPSAASLALFAAYADPIHLRVFLCAARPADLAFAARLAKCVEAAANPVLSAEFVGVAADLTEPAALIAESAVTAAPEAVVYWMGAEIARLRPDGAGTVDEELAALIQRSRTSIAEEMILDNEFFRNVFHSDLLLDCKRCHGPR